MLPFHSCYIYVTWRSKEVVRRRDVLKPSFEGGGEERLFLWDAVDHSRHHAYNLLFSLVIALWLIDEVNHHMHLFLTCTYSRQFQTFFSMPLKNLQVLLKFLHKMVIFFVTHRQ